MTTMTTTTMTAMTTTTNLRCSRPRPTILSGLTGLACLFGLALLSAGCVDPEAALDGDLVADDALDDALDDAALSRVESALLSPQVIGLSSSGVGNPMATVDTNLFSSTIVDHAVDHCPLHNNGPFIKLNAGFCLGPATTYFYGWEMVTFRVDNGGNVDSVDVQLTHGRAGLATTNPQTLIYTSWDGVSFSYAGAFSASSTTATRTVRVVPPTRPAPNLIVVFAKSTATAAPPGGPTLRWYEVGLRSNYVAAPTNLAARTVSSSAIDLTWTDTSTAESDFELQVQELLSWRTLRTIAANQTAERISNLAAGTSYTFRLRARSATSSSPFSNLASATTLAGPPASLAVVNTSQVDILAFALDGAQRPADQTSGNRSTFSVAAGSHTVSAALGFAATGSRVCDWSGQANVASGQTFTFTILPLTAGQVLTHCGGPIDYNQGSYVDLNGLHTVAMRFHANGTYQWWHDGDEQQSGTITSTTLAPPALAFTLSSGDRIAMGWPFDIFNLNVNGFSVQLVRTNNW